MATKTQESSARLIKVIHVGKRQLGLDDETYRTMLRAATGRDSTKGMTYRELRAVLLSFKRAGFSMSKPDVTDYSPQASKIRALWLALHAAGEVRNKSERALLAYVKRITGAEKMEWCTSKQLQSVIETLKAWGDRVEDEAARAKIAAIAEEAAA
ncbi:gp16 family protein [Nitratidesulfovibrio liaohensis]|uniref:gp16 family protein n=1 Tax=Nitratidesulfovibrio liaohensis TaxID=2604158 RepID=UPI001423D58D|nr:regulatory protein GemA [Nitratidesulfovibrio liaohensis]NHZ48623.1 regulatory protein GemA [Nitratidesulfovibrio liaohensis]